MSREFPGSKAKTSALLCPIEQKIVHKFVGKIPKSIETYHLTLMTVLWCPLILIFYYLARQDLRWLWLASLMIILQYVTDLFDGAVGRYRNTGLIRWGYYMDHFLDYVFLCCILIGYSFILHEKQTYWLFFVLAIGGAYMVNSFLLYSALDKVKYEYLKIGPTEVRLSFIIINILLSVFGRTNLAAIVPYALGLALIGLIWVVYSTQKIVWEYDIKIKKKLK
ncbi:CDP-alcohol phosphatidyltransferase family protein [Candidatus Woesearchaeota archaeon]|nr:CDP-alcohol phosphatidyltransferase family protein [Candidatus Woesearchaeota archaeon]